MFLFDEVAKNRRISDSVEIPPAGGGIQLNPMIEPKMDAG